MNRRLESYYHVSHYFFWELKKDEKTIHGYNGSRVRCVNILLIKYYFLVHKFGRIFIWEENIMYKNCFCTLSQVSLLFSSRFLYVYFRTSFPLSVVDLCLSFPLRCMRLYLSRTSNCFSLSPCVFFLFLVRLYWETVSKLSIIYIGLCIVATGLEFAYSISVCRKLCTSVGVIRHCIAVSG